MAQLPAGRAAIASVVAAAAATAVAGVKPPAICSGVFCAHCLASFAFVHCLLLMSHAGSMSDAGGMLAASLMWLLKAKTISFCNSSGYPLTASQHISGQLSDVQ